MPLQPLPTTATFFLDCIAIAGRKEILLMVTPRGLERFNAFPSRQTQIWNGVRGQVAQKRTDLGTPTIYSGPKYEYVKAKMSKASPLARPRVCAALNGTRCYAACFATSYLSMAIELHRCNKYIRVRKFSNMQTLDTMALCPLASKLRRQLHNQESSLKINQHMHFIQQINFVLFLI